MRILHIHNRYRQQGGEDVVVESERRLLAEGGHDVVPFDEVNPPGAAAAISLAFAPHNPLSAMRIGRTVDRAAPDVAHVHNTWFALSPSVIRRLRSDGLPVVWTAHNYRIACANGLLFRDGATCVECLGSSPWRSVRYGCYRDRPSSVFAAATIALARKADTWGRCVNVAIALTEFGRSFLVEAGFDPDRVVVKPNFTSDPGPRRRPPSESNRVLFVGRLTEEKGIRVLLEAWSRVRPRSLRLTIVGDGPLVGLVRADPHIEFLGAVDRATLTRLMLSSRVLVFPSTWFEGQPLVLLEALAAALPVIGSAIGGVAELVQASGFDGAVRPGDVDQLADALNRAEETDPDAASRIARQAWMERFSPGAALSQLEGIYARAMSVG